MVARRASTVLVIVRSHGRVVSLFTVCFSISLEIKWQKICSLAYSTRFQKAQTSSYFTPIFLQFIVSVFVLRLFLCETRNTKYIVAAGLAQVSEFSFVLGSRARRFHLISREVRFVANLLAANCQVAVQFVLL